jgi:hypothetical protein
MSLAKTPARRNARCERVEKSVVARIFIVSSLFFVQHG